MVGGDEELDDGLGEEGGERGTNVDVFDAWSEKRQENADRFLLRMLADILRRLG